MGETTALMRHLSLRVPHPIRFGAKRYRVDIAVAGLNTYRLIMDGERVTVHPHGMLAVVVHLWDRR